MPVDQEGRHVVRQRLGRLGGMALHQLAHAEEEGATGLGGALEVTLDGVGCGAHPGILPVSPIGVTRAAAVLHPALPPRPGGRARSDDAQLGDRPVADLLGEPGQQA